VGFPHRIASAAATRCSEGASWVTAATQTRHNRTSTVDFPDEATYVQRLDDGKAFAALMIAFLRALGFQLQHQATSEGGGCPTRHSHYVRIRLGGLTIWRLQCMTSGSLQAFLTELAHLDNLASYQRQATHAGQYGVAVKGGRVSTSDWMFNLHILTSGGCR
jgi:hypothetical protein